MQEARAAGARALTGGAGHADGGRFYEPTVLVDVDHSMAAMTEETFGPVVPVMKVADADEAVRLANDSEYGLAASVWTKDARRGEEIARRIEAGAVCVNDAQLNYLALELPMGGWKASGLGTRHGAGGIRKFCRQQSLFVTRFAPPGGDLQFYPFKAGRMKLVRRLIRLLYGRGRQATRPRARASRCAAGGGRGAAARGRRPPSGPSARRPRSGSGRRGSAAR